jgi:hypothetical protein
MMRTLRAVQGNSLVQLIEDGEVLAAVYNYTLHHLITNGFAPTVERYLQLDTLAMSGLSKMLTKKATP